jgi:hypothetical protein
MDLAASAATPAPVLAWAWGRRRGLLASGLKPEGSASEAAPAAEFAEGESGAAELEAVVLAEEALAAASGGE